MELEKAGQSAIYDNALGENNLFLYRYIVNILIYLMYL